MFRIRRFLVCFCTMILAMNALTSLSIAESEQTIYEIGHYCYSIPAEWEHDYSEEDQMHYHYETGNPMTGGFLMTMCMEHPFGEEAATDVFFDTFIESFTKQMEMENYAYIDSLTCPAVLGLTTRGFSGSCGLIDANADLFVYIWSDVENLYIFSYSNPALTSQEVQEGMNEILATVALEGSEESVSDVSTSKEYINIDLNYSEYARNPDTHEGESIEFSGKVIQVIENSNSSQYRVAIGGDSDCVFFVEYARPEGSSRILKDDQVTVRGKSVGTVTYESTMGGQITIPACIADEMIEYKPISIQAAGSQSEESADDFETVGYRYEHSNKHDLYLAITNNTGRNVRIDILVKYLDENGGLVGIHNASEEAFAAGTQMLVSTSNDIPFESYEYEINAKDETYYAPVVDALEIEKTMIGNKVIVGITNTGSIAAKFVEYNVLFLNHGDVVDTEWGFATDSDSEIKPGKSEYIEVKSSQEFDEALIFLKGRGDK